MSSPSDQPTADGQQAAIATCPNCGEPRPRRFCAECGQSDRDYRRSSWAVVGDFLRETFEVDSKVLRTLKLLPRPGRLSIEFARNRRASYVSPVRLYLFASVIYFFAISQGPWGGGAREPADIAQPAATSQDIGTAGGAASSSPPIQAQIAILKTWMPPETGSKLDEIMRRPGGPELVAGFLQVTGGLIERLPDESNSLERAWLAVGIEFMHDPGFFRNDIVGSISVGAIFFVPVAALMLALIYYRKKRYFAEHLVLQIHIQTFSFLVTSVIVLLPGGMLGTLASTALGLWTLYYAAAAMKHFYGDGWLRTLFKLCLLMLLYAVVVTPILGTVVALRL